MPVSNFRARAVLFCFFILSPISQLRGSPPAAESIPTQLPGHDAILMGTDWYPEQWPESRWDTDLSMMEAAHLSVVRIGEFAWSRMEPSEGHFDFDWLERAIRLAEKHHVVVVLGTPTAGPPAWLTQKYPDTLRMETDDRRVTHGNRAQGSVTSARYREFCRRIAAQMARRLGHDPNVIGWQIDNEYGYGQMSYDDDAKQQFQSWVKAKYKSLASLNQHWTTAYWSESYDNWSEIPIPWIPHNPGLMLDWRRFVTFAWTSYEQNQIDAIRPLADPRQFITGNFMGYGFNIFDHFVVAQPLSFASWDDYVGSGHLDPDTNGMSHDAMRGLKRRNFWVIEMQPGFVNWSALNNSLNKGEVRAMAWHDIGHGADEISYWQWRSALNGQEEMHGTLVGPDGEPEPVLSEVAQTATEFAQVQSAFRDTRVVSEVALLQDYESRWAINWQEHTARYDELTVLRSYYHAIRKLSQSLDIVHPDVPLDHYKLVVAPNLNLIPKDRADHLLEYVKNGGHLVLGPRSGLKDEFNALLPLRQPGYLAYALGGHIEQFYALERNAPVSGTLGSGEALIWAEQLNAKSPDAEVLLRYGASNGWLDGQPAILTRPFGKGRITYVGAVLDNNLMAALANWLVKTSDVIPALGPVPDGIEVSGRVGPHSSVYVLINFNSERQTVPLPRPMQSLLPTPPQTEAGSSAAPAPPATSTPQEPVTQVELDRYGVAILLDQTKP
ncbi:MAG TPA: beta-galactosidase [Candidatus Methylomirabilis sp.]|nr:beta-galactosidase [Candidatus Methylomirabilis sp.]